MNKCVFNLDLNVLSLCGKSFQRIGAALQKVLSPQFVYLPGRLSLTLSMFLIYEGAILLRAFKVNIIILNFIQVSMGSQCKDFLACVMWSYFLSVITTLVAVFCTSGIMLISYLGDHKVPSLNSLAWRL